MISLMGRILNITEKLEKSIRHKDGPQSLDLQEMEDIMDILEPTIKICHLVRRINR